ncbi:Cation/H+ exchanger [Dillenia turbinata]|uniref:Cation/H+ exchanger n=1 Tax=Dillenia turbinata TaxID=194707 RepID=A0AAN8V8X4_9MAGN
MIRGQRNDITRKIGSITVARHGSTYMDPLFLCCKDTKAKDSSMLIIFMETQKATKVEMNQVPYVCSLLGNTNSKGIWFGDDPLKLKESGLALDKKLDSIRSLKGHPGGVILGPSVLGHNTEFSNKMFPKQGKPVTDTIAFFGFMLFIFLVGVKTDAAMVLKSGRMAWAIGILAFVVPYALAGLVAFLLDRFLSLEDNISNVLYIVVTMHSMSAFPVIVLFLDELKILNSDIGRLASSSSIICDVCHWFTFFMTLAAKIATLRSIQSIIGTILSSVTLIALIVFGIRPAALWTVRQTPEGRPVKEIYIFTVLVLLLCCGFIGDVIGMTSLLTSFLFGLAIPDGPPLGAALVERLDCFVSVLLMPIFFTISGLKMDVFSIQKLEDFGMIQLIAFVAFLGKILGTIVPPLLCRMPLRDALSLALIMNSKGIVELASLNHWTHTKVINEENYTIIAISEVIITGAISPLVKLLYDPSRRYIAYKRRTVFHKRPNEELRILACLHNEDSVPTFMNLLNFTNPTKLSPISLYILHLVKLTGRSASQLIPYRPREKTSVNRTRTERIFNVFRKLEQQKDGPLTVQFFKGVSPYETMHNDVCSLALEKRITLALIPIHKQWLLGEVVESSYALRHLNKNVLENAPCSVGVIIDRANVRKFLVNLADSSLHKVAVFFFGGADDREALAYALHMSAHPGVVLTLVRFSSSEDIVLGTARSRTLDSESLSEYKLHMMHNERVLYREEVVTAGSGLLPSLRSMRNSYDLVMVGRRHGHSPFMLELRKWNEHGELGIVGEILSSPIFKGTSAVLVMQQQTRLWGLHDPEESTHLRRIKI